MKILYLITGLGGGGAEKVVADLADQMIARGHLVKIAYLKGENIIVKPRSNYIEIIYLGLESPFNILSAYKEYNKIIKDFKPNVVHSHMVHANIFARLNQLFNKVHRLICTAHSNNEGGYMRMLAYRLTNNLANLTTIVSKKAAEEFIAKKAVPYGRIKPIYNGINLNKFYYRSEAREKILRELNLSKDEILVLSVGRLNEQKDYPNLLNSILFLKSKYNRNFKFLIAGDGELKNQIIHLINQLNLINDVILLGRRNDIPDLMSAADLFVLPSKDEGFGLVIAEAMACETLVVATDCGGVSEVLNNSEFLVPSCEPLELAEKIYYAINLKEDIKRKIILKNLHYVRNNFSLDIIAKEWIKIYYE